MKFESESIKLLFKEVYKKGFFHLFSSNILIQIFAFASQLFVAGILSPDDVGRIKVIQTYLGIFTVAASMGFYASVVKYCSEDTIPKKVKFQLFYHSLFFTLISSVSVYVIVLLVNYAGWLSADKLIRSLIPLAFIPLITNTLFVVFVSYSQALKRIKVLSLLTIANKIISIVGIMLLAFYWGVKGYFVAYNLSFILMLLICFYFLFKQHKITTFKFSLESIRYNFKRQWRYARLTMFSSLVNECMMYMDILLISFFVLDAYVVGYYGFALTMTVVLRIFPSTVQQISIPYFSATYENKHSFKSVFKKYNTILYIVVFVTLLLVFVFAPPLVTWVFNGKYDNSMPYFFPLATAWSISQLRQLQGGAIFGLGKVEYNLYVSCIMFGINLLVYSSSLYLWGLIGIAYASIFTAIISVIISRLYLRKAYNQISPREN